MHHGADLVLGEYARQQRAVADVADHQRRIADRLAEAGRQIVHDHHRFIAGPQLQDDVAADISGTAGDQHGILRGHYPILRAVRNCSRP